MSGLGVGTSEGLQGDRLGFGAAALAGVEGVNRGDLLTGTIGAGTTFAEGDLRGKLPRFTEDARAANQAVIDLLTAIATRAGATNAQVALAWLLAQHSSIVPIPGTTKLHRLAENVAATDVQLSAQDVADLTAASDQLPVQDERYPEAMQRWINR